MAASVSLSRWCALAASGALGASDGAAIGCAEGSAPRNGGGGVLVWTVTTSFHPARGVTVAGEVLLPTTSGPPCSVSCNRLKMVPAAIALGPALVKGWGR